MIGKYIEYKEQQTAIIDEIASILNLEEHPIYTLEELDNNHDIQTKIMNLIPDIKQYFNCNNLKAVTDTSRIKRPWLSIIKTMLKSNYQIITEDVHVKKDNNFIHTKKYTFIYLCV
tara:strand:- start:301 stop:648 length:348 start_codon:yes stop_codon:yes gene_type:complete